MTKPNIFKYATKELSQDAFILWLLDHANPIYDKVDQDLKKCALKIIEYFFLLENKEMPKTIKTFKLFKQEKFIDIVLYLNEFMIIIEDKTESKAHGNQLIRYKTFAEEKVGKDNVLAIFFKTHDQSNYLKEERDGFKVFERKHLLKILQEVHIESDIFNDFKSYILGIEENISSFESTNSSNWKKEQWIGFFKYLQYKLNQGDWKYVANPSGGFMGFWWARHKFENYSIYLQIEKQKLNLKIHCPDSKLSRQFRGLSFKYYLKKSRENNLNFIKPTRFGSGKTMTILQTEYFVVNEDKSINFDKTIQHLEIITTFIQNNAICILH